MQLENDVDVAFDSLTRRGNALNDALHQRILGEFAKPIRDRVELDGREALVSSRPRVGVDLLGCCTAHQQVQTHAVSVLSSK